MNGIIRFFLSGLAVLLDGLSPAGRSCGALWICLLVAALFISLANIFVKPILVILTIPITIFTLGLFLLVINALIILLVESIRTRI